MQHCQGVEASLRAWKDRGAGVQAGAENKPEESRLGSDLWATLTFLLQGEQEPIKIIRTRTDTIKIGILALTSGSSS